MGREDYEVYDALKHERKIEGEQRRIMAGIEFPQAKRLAEDAGLQLVRYSDAHYKLRKLGHGGWYVELYPGNQRIYRPPLSTPPFIRVGSPWSLVEVVTAAIEADKKRAPVQEPTR